jgi:hypothetical protein
MWLPIVTAIWGCIPELAKEAKDCIDMTNSSSTYLGILAGAAIGAVISWWIYNRQNKMSHVQESILKRINGLEDHNTNILISLEASVKRHDELLNKILILNESIVALDRKIQSMIE